MKISEIKSCFIGPARSPEQFIAKHFFLFLAKGTMNAAMMATNIILKTDESCLVTIPSEIKG
ncbi:hypothetical protein N824_19285 [Pedobacter sp. V48]|nr:hypothetical protein N824_19285 [Pedobacter sp. V48]